MYKDIISYQLVEGITKDHLLKVAQEIIDTWMKKQPGFISWEINTTDNDIMVDIVTWESKAAAKAAEKEMMNIPNAGDWFACYKQGSISSLHLFLEKGF